MPQEHDRVQREIEELLDKLDNFVPEERLVSKIKSRRRREEGPGTVGRAWDGLRLRVSRMTLGHLMIAGIVLMLLAWLAPGLFAGYARWASLLGVALTVIAFVASFIARDSRRTIAGARHYEKRWRGQVIEYSEPPATARIRDWFRRRGRH